MNNLRCSCKTIEHESLTCPDYRYCLEVMKPYPVWARELALKAQIPVNILIPFVNLYNRNMTDFLDPNIPSSYQKILKLCEGKTLNLSSKKDNDK